MIVHAGRVAPADRAKSPYLDPGLSDPALALVVAGANEPNLRQVSGRSPIPSPARFQSRRPRILTRYHPNHYNALRYTSGGDRVVR